MDYMHFTGKHIFWIVKSFRGRCDYKCNNLVIVTYFRGSFTSVTGASNLEQGSLEQCKISTGDLHILFYSKSAHDN